MRVTDPVRRAASGSGLLTLGAVLLLLALPFVVYAPFLGDFFALDDFIWLHAATHPWGEALRRAVTFPTRIPLDVPTPFWRPLLDVYFLLAWRLFGLDALPYHLVNLTVHALNGVLLALLVVRLGGRRATAWIAGALFSVWPAYDFAVVWISDLTDLLGLFWYLGTLLCFTEAQRRPAARRRWYAGALACFVLGLGTKESSVTVPAMLLGIALVCSPPRSPRALAAAVRRVAPFAAVALLYALALYFAEYRTAAGSGLYALGTHVFDNLWSYLRRLSWSFSAAPARLSTLSAGVFVLVGMAALVRRRRLTALAFFWTVLALLPFAFFPAGIEGRYVYLAAAPFALYLATLVQAAADRLPHAAGMRAGLVAAGALAAALLILTLARETRERQAWISEQARAYATLFQDVPAVCGALRPGAQVLILDSPVWDYFGESSRMALNLRYEAVFVDHATSASGAWQPEADAAECTVRFESSTYRREEHAAP